MPSSLVTSRVTCHATPFGAPWMVWPIPLKSSTSRSKSSLTSLHVLCGQSSEPRFLSSLLASLANCPEASSCGSVSCSSSYRRQRRRHEATFNPHCWSLCRARGRRSSPASLHNAQSSCSSALALARLHLQLPPLAHTTAPRLRRSVTPPHRAPARHPQLGRLATRPRRLPLAPLGGRPLHLMQVLQVAMRYRNM